MCGIAGIFSANNTVQITDKQLNSMATPLYHRGPDSNGTWVSPQKQVGFAHTRLAIQDLSPAGHQPMTSHSGRFIITYNGEIYNFHKLKKELEKLNVQFNGASDTEILLAGIETWGLTLTLQKAEGMFALALWDNKENTLQLARDRVGEKPLYFSVFNNTVAFASQLSAIKQLNHFPRTICNEAVRLFLRYGYIPTPYAIYENAFKLPPGSILSINQQQLKNIGTQQLQFSDISELFQITKYWDIHDVALTGSNNQCHDEHENITSLKNILEDTIQDQMIADVPYGAFLSGGIDSSLIVSVMQSISAKPVKTFTIGFSNKDFNEAHHAKEIAQHLGTEHNELYVSDQELLDVIPKLSTMYDEPFADPSQIPTYIVAAMTKQSVTIALSGDGGDELYAGYNRYRMLKLWQLKQKIPNSIRNHALLPAISLYKKMSNGKSNRLFRMLNKNQGAQSSASAIINKIEQIMMSNSHKDAYRYMLSSIDTPDSYLAQPPTGVETDFFPSVGNLDEFQSMLLWDQMLYLQNDNLVKVDRASMAVSLETRHPLLNHRVIEHSWRVPQSQKMTKTDNKLMLKKLLGQYLPTEFIDRPKMGFSVPIKSWLTGPLQEWGNDLLNEKAIQEQGILSPKTTNNIWHGLTNNDSNPLLVWRLLMLEAWSIEAQRNAP